ncbi:MAG: response regulator [Gemmatimonadetes bacterium]|nr:response regulator [Gemmatimonadota bacterium]
MTSGNGPEAPQTDPPRRQARVMIAEDDMAAANVLQTLLGRVGYDVSLAEDGAIALKMLEDGPPPDILLLDWMLPAVSGLEICRRVRERWDPITVPILMVTAKTDADSISSAFAAGASDYLTKPFLGAELRARIAAHLRIKSLLDERMRMEEHLAEREKLSTLGLLVSGVAHDLNNPLGGISGYAQLLLDQESQPEKIAALNRIIAEVSRCNRIVADLLSFARRQPTERTRVNVGEVLQSTMELRLRHLQDSGLRTQVEIEPELDSITGDPHQLQQVFLNIVVNAEHALRHGGDTLRVSVGEAPPSTARNMGREWVQISFYNDGPPIPADALPHIFDPFFTTKASDEGTGLGLAICRRILREHGGDIDVESGEEGTTFRIVLPGDGEGNREQGMGNGDS